MECKEYRGRREIVYIMCLMYIVCPLTTYEHLKDIYLNGDYYEKTIGVYLLGSFVFISFISHRVFTTQRIRIYENGLEKSCKIIRTHKESIIWKDVISIDIAESRYENRPIHKRSYPKKILLRSNDKKIAISFIGYSEPDKILIEIAEKLPAHKQKLLNWAKQIEGKSMFRI